MTRAREVLADRIERALRYRPRSDGWPPLARLCAALQRKSAALVTYESGTRGALMHAAAVVFGELRAHGDARACREGRRAGIESFLSGPR